MDDLAPRPQEIRPLTGARGAAAVLVMLYHFGLNGGRAALPPFLLHGYLWVDFFFVLSGFVMALAYGPLFARRPAGMDAYGMFLAHRVARVCPLYWAVTLCAMVLLAAGGPADAAWPAAAGLLSNLLMVQAWGLADSIVHPGWSVSAEWAAYALFPVLLAVATRTTPRTAGALALGCAAAVIALATLPRPMLGIDPALSNGPLDINQAGSLAPVLRCLAGFTLGVLTCRLSLAPPAAVRAVIDRPRAAGCAAGALLLALCLPAGADLLAYALFPAVILLLGTGRGGRAGAVLASRPMHRLGTLSYGIYLVHVPIGTLWTACLAQVPGTLPAGLRHALASLALAALSVAVAALCHAVIEAPGRALVRRLLAPRPAAALPGALAQAGPA